GPETGRICRRVRLAAALHRASYAAPIVVVARGGGAGGGWCEPGPGGRGAVPGGLRRPEPAVRAGRPVPGGADVAADRGGRPPALARLRPVRGPVRRGRRGGVR